MNGNIPLFRLIADALADQPFDVVIALGDGIPREALGEVAGNIRVGGYLPQARILERASVVVSHGGYGTVSAALGCRTAAVPAPHGRGSAVQRRAVHHGRRRPRRDPGPAPGPPQAGPPPFTPPDPQVIRDGTRRLLDEPAFREAAGAIAAEIAAMPTADYAAELLEAAVRADGEARLRGSGAPVPA